MILPTEARREQDHRRANKDLVNLLPEVTQMKAELKIRVRVPMHQLFVADMVTSTTNVLSPGIWLGSLHRYRETRTVPRVHEM